MKTKNNTRETVDDQVRRMVLRGSAFLFSLVLFGQTANALNFQAQFSDNNTDRKMTLLKVNETSKTEATVAAKGSTELNISFETFVCEPEQEKDLVAEDWMMNESNFNSAAFITKEEAEESLKVEDWMLDNDYFVHSLVSESAELEKPLEIEAWMTNDQLWGF